MPFVQLNGKWINRGSDLALIERGGVLSIKAFISAAALEPGPIDASDYELKLNQRKNSLFLVQDDKNFYQYDHTGLARSKVNVALPVVFTQDFIQGFPDTTFPGNLAILDEDKEVRYVALPDAVEPQSPTNVVPRKWTSLDIHDVLARKLGNVPKLSGFYSSIPGDAYAFLSGRYALAQAQEAVYYFWGAEGNKQQLNTQDEIFLFSLDQGDIPRLGTFFNQDLEFLAYASSFVRSNATARSRITLRPNTRYNINHNHGAMLPPLTRTISGDTVFVANITDKDFEIFRNASTPIHNTQQETDDSMVLGSGATVTFWLDSLNGDMQGWWFAEVAGRAYLSKNKPITNRPPIISYDGKPLPEVTKTNTLWDGAIALTIFDPPI